MTVISSAAWIISVQIRLVKGIGQACSLSHTNTSYIPLTGKHCCVDFVHCNKTCKSSDTSAFLWLLYSTKQRDFASKHSQSCKTYTSPHTLLINAFTTHGCHITKFNVLTVKICIIRIIDKYRWNNISHDTMWIVMFLTCCDCGWFPFGKCCERQFADMLSSELQTQWYMLQLACHNQCSPAHFLQINHFDWNFFQEVGEGENRGLMQQLVSHNTFIQLLC